METPGSHALEAAKNIKDIVIFKTPTEPVRRITKYKPKILDEDTYVERMGEIIQRDFFPHLEKLKAHNDYVDALRQNDAGKMRQLYEKYGSEMPSTERLSSPATFETPLREDNYGSMKNRGTDNKSVNNDHHSSKMGDEILKKTNKIGLNAYLSAFTSEDNASFQEMMNEAEKKRRIKYSWLYEMEESSHNVELEKEKLALTNDNRKKLKPSTLDSWSYKNKNYIMYIPDGVEMTPEEKIELSKKSQEIVHMNTRLVISPFNEKQNKETINELAKSQSKANDGKIGVDGKEVARCATGDVNRFNLVATPSPRPGEYDSPLMTWGEIEGTPFKLDSGDTPLLRSSQGPTFRMAEPPKREKLALQLAEKAGERHRDRKNKALEAARKSFSSPSPKCLSSIDRLSTMSPAARRLATQKFKIASSPSPRRKLLGSPSIKLKTSNFTNLLSGTTSEKHTMNNLFETESSYKSRSGAVLTDNLLNLPRRQRASDFFNQLTSNLHE